LFGYDQGVMSGIIDSDQFIKEFPEVAINSSWQGFIVSCYAVGCFFGAIFILSLGDRLGRRKSIYIGATVMIIGVIIQLCCVKVSGGTTAQFIIGRFITGVSQSQTTAFTSFQR
jgi:MFS family permease